MKLHLLAAAATVLAAPAAIAGPYVNIESNSGFAGNDYAGSTLEPHIGVAADLSDSTGLYLQAGPAFILPDDGDSDTQFSGKAGVTHAMSDSWSAYGEYAFLTTDDDLASNVKLGVTYEF